MMSHKVKYYRIMDIVCMDIQKKTTPPTPLVGGVCLLYIKHACTPLEISTIDIFS